MSEKHFTVGAIEIYQLRSKWPTSEPALNLRVICHSH